MRVTTREQRPVPGSIWICQPGGQTNVYSDPAGRFSIIASGRRDARTYLQTDAYSAGRAFIEAQLEVHGDLFAAIRSVLNQSPPRLRRLLFSAWSKVGHLPIRFALGRARARKSIRFHYDRSNEFYAQFLDSRMLYSAAHFEDPEDSLENAQLQKLNDICRDLVLHSEEHFLDIGCGWGALVRHAAEEFGTRSLGCTLSPQQFQFATEMIQQRRLEQAAVRCCDYRELQGSFDKIASVGMFEHVGCARLPGYFAKVYSLLRPGGLFLNRGIVRPQGTCSDPETLFLQRHVFPNGELVHLDDVIREGERAGFEVVGLRDLRMHYALTCRCWVENLQRKAEHCRALVGETTYRIWLLYLAASAVNFEDGQTQAAQVLFSKRREPVKGPANNRAAV